METPTNLNEILQWLFGASGGALVVIGWFTVVVLDKFAWWNSLDATVKKFVTLILAVVLGIGSRLLFLHPEVVAVIEPYVMVFVSIAIIWLSNEFVHMRTKVQFQLK
jgi:hypothetical protein